MSPVAGTLSEQDAESAITRKSKFINGSAQVELRFNKNQPYTGMLAGAECHGGDDRLASGRRAADWGGGLLQNAHKNSVELFLFATLESAVWPNELMFSRSDAVKHFC